MLSQGHDPLWAVGSVTQLGQVDKGPVMTRHCDVGDQGNKSEAEPAVAWAGAEHEAAGSEWLKDSPDVLAGVWLLGPRVFESYSRVVIKIHKLCSLVMQTTWASVQNPRLR